MKISFQFPIEKIIVASSFFLLSCSVNEPLVRSQSNVSDRGNQVSVNDRSRDQDNFAHLKSEHREALKEWLRNKEYLRPAVEQLDDGMFQVANYHDKTTYEKDFKANMEMLRQTVGESGYQYYSVGDMNGDGKEDFAVLLVDGRETNDSADHFALAIFNAPFTPGELPSFYEDNLNGISNAYISFDRTIKGRLFLGKFESDVYCAIYYPKGKSYFFKDCVGE